MEGYNNNNNSVKNTNVMTREIQTRSWYNYMINTATAFYRDESTKSIRGGVQVKKYIILSRQF